MRDLVLVLLSLVRVKNATIKNAIKFCTLHFSSFYKFDLLDPIFPTYIYIKVSHSHRYIHSTSDLDPTSTSPASTSTPYSHPENTIPPNTKPPTLSIPKMTHTTLPTQTRPTMSQTAIDAHFAEVARGQIAVTNNSDHARNTYITRQLNHQFNDRFGMSDAAAKAAVAEEMNRRYRSNPWDAPGPRRPRPQRKIPVATKEKAKEQGGEEETRKAEERRSEEEERKAEGYGEEQWDLFERQFGYK